MVNNESMEMYLETILIFEKRYGHAHVTDIAKELNVSKPSVTKATKYLREQGYVDKEPYGSIVLTEKGREVAERIYRNHGLIMRFLEHSLNMKPEDADKDACRIEHVVSEKMIEAIEEYLIKNNECIKKG
ncbi:iron (metal) dependent repressor, DtxR family [Dethiosulfatibacter aminovorans DSM 17477]|uniref:Iron (Metal) dependent repressor, DtxR family n=1 Tax=Dethiosulfatibacter aminovorans DSM 17477 TaxID=1121476 RepID=A0A1M6IRU6_9FIRM|nr:metal-dependent transcriptional regulator [Dethiosulfatibacter aminovorans]SHJ37186.1 iron (metal) dependent repressor, DtxR family [Dethiosulfatibacter aminovorans DSM 17477]